MITLNKNELLNINGGVAVWGIITIFGIVTFIIGVIDGIVRPLKCNK